jgi:hypothetical protein
MDLGQVWRWGRSGRWRWVRWGMNYDSCLMLGRAHFGVTEFSILDRRQLACKADRRNGGRL